MMISRVCYWHLCLNFPIFQASSWPDKSLISRNGIWSWLKCTGTMQTFSKKSVSSCRPFVKKWSLLSFHWLRKKPTSERYVNVMTLTYNLLLGIFLQNYPVTTSSCDFEYRIRKSTKLFMYLGLVSELLCDWSSNLNFVGSERPETSI